MAPAMVSLMALPFSASTSFFSEMSVAMMSALCTFTTRGIVPCSRIVSTSTKSGALSRVTATHVRHLLEPSSDLAVDFLRQESSHGLDFRADGRLRIAMSE